MVKIFILLVFSTPGQGLYNVILGLLLVIFIIEVIRPVDCTAVKIPFVLLYAHGRCSSLGFLYHRRKVGSIHSFGFLGFVNV